MPSRQALKTHLYLPPAAHPAPFQTLKTSYISPVTLLQSSPITAFSVPGFPTSSRRRKSISALPHFFSTLQYNIFIDTSYDSPSHTPYDLRPTSSGLTSVSYTHSMSSLDADTAPIDALNLPTTITEPDEGLESKEATIGEDGIPLLKTFAAHDDDARAEGLHIVADSVAQQRNIGSRAIIFHPIFLAVLVAAVGILTQIFNDQYGRNWILIGTTTIGVVMAMLGAIRMLLGPYIFEAERIGTWKWLNQGRSAEEQEETGLKVLDEVDEVLITKFGDEFIGSIIFRGVQPISPASPGTNKRTRRAQSPTKHTRMVIRAWSVKQKYRRKEVGSALLEEAMKVGQEKGWIQHGVEIAKDHANSKRVLPAIFNGALDKFDQIAQNTLDKKLDKVDRAQEKGRKRK